MRNETRELLWWITLKSINSVLRPLMPLIDCLVWLTEPLSPVYTIQHVVKPVVKPVWQPVVKPVVQHGLTTGWTNSGCSFNTVVKPVVQLVWQPVVSWKRGISFKSKEITLHVHKCLVRPHTENLQSWRLYYQKNMNLLQEVDRRVARTGNTALQRRLNWGI